MGQHPGAWVLGVRMHRKGCPRLRGEGGGVPGVREEQWACLNI